MRIFNINGNEPLIYHMNGSMNDADIVFRVIPKNAALTCPDDLTVVIVESHFNVTYYQDFTQEMQPVIYQLVSNHIPFVNGFYVTPSMPRFTLLNKVNYFLHGLKRVKTKYSLLLDSRDVKIRSFDGIIEKFLSYDTRILFSAEKGNYGIHYNRIEQHNELHGALQKYANTGGIIGYTDDLIEFFQKTVDALPERAPGNVFMELMDVPGWTDGVEYRSGTDQGYIRSFFNDYDQNQINVDYKSQIFMSFAYTNFYAN